MNLKSLTIFLFVHLTFYGISQDSIRKNNIIGLGLTTSYSYGTPNYFAKTPNIFFRLGRHELNAGFDFYTQKYEGLISGLQSEYKYYLLRQTRPFNIYALTNFQYVKFGQGRRWDVPYKYAVDNNLTKQKTFNNTFGVGFYLAFLKIFSFNIEYSYGYTYQTWTSTSFDTGTFSTPLYKLGLSANIYKW
jgi:hypothetical protein